ncbi:MAG TPA: DUF805 domain-containing protein [Roseibacterium sp.]|nr:DUF805 domain-containing protein [Roseibacterium sp.]
MDFMTAVKRVLTQNYANFSGRARRSEYWWFFLFIMIANIVAQTVDAAIGLPILTIIVGLGLIVPGIALAIRRMHDTGRSGWWLLIGLIPLAGIVILFWFVQRGTVGSNEFGDDPYDAPAAA